MESRANSVLEKGILLKWLKRIRGIQLMNRKGGEGLKKGSGGGIE